MSWPAAVFWLILIWATASRGPALIYLVYIAGAFGSLQMLPGGGAGVNLLPQSVCAALLVAKVLNQRGNLARAVEAMLDPSRVLLLTAFMAYSLVTAFALPRLYAGLIEVVPVSNFSVGTSILAVNSGNVTQSCYMLLSFGTVVAFSVIGSKDELHRQLRLAILWSSVVLALTGLADLVCYRAGLGALLDPFRTATYALLTDVEAVGAKRVVGLEPEASAFGFVCVSTAALLIFMRPLYAQGQERRLATGMIFVMVAMVALSTSSSAYVGLASLALLYAARLTRRVIDRSRSVRSAISLEIIAVLLLALVASLVFLVRSDLLQSASDMIDKMVFQKGSSASYVERSQWNRVGFQAFLDTGGLGAGLGSLRTSSWAVSILGSVGVLGATAIFGFVLQSLIPSSPGADPHAEIHNALRLSLGPTLLIYQLGGTIPDVGVPTAVLLGILASGSAVEIVPAKKYKGKPDGTLSRSPVCPCSPSDDQLPRHQAGFGTVIRATESSAHLHRGPDFCSRSRPLNALSGSAGVDPVDETFDRDLGASDVGGARASTGGTGRGGIGVAR